MTLLILTCKIFIQLSFSSTVNCAHHWSLVFFIIHSQILMLISYFNYRDHNKVVTQCVMTTTTWCDEVELDDGDDEQHSIFFTAVCEMFGTSRDFSYNKENGLGRILRKMDLVIFFYYVKIMAVNNPIKKFKLRLFLKQLFLISQKSCQWFLQNFKLRWFHQFCD